MPDSDPHLDADVELRFRAKAQLRKQATAVRRAVPKAARARRSSILCDRLVELPEWRSAREVTGYDALGSEADPAGALAQARVDGKSVSLPRLSVGDDHLTIHRVEAGDPLEMTSFGFRQPHPDAPEVRRVDLVIIPGLAFDETGYRLGWGKGFYDRLLPHLGTAIRVGIGFDFQQVPELPATPDDARLDLLVTDAGVVRFSR